MPNRYKPAILVVDDEKPIRKFISLTLRRAGYAVLEAEGGLQAMAIVLSHPGEIPLAVVDIVMPGIGGLDLANQIAMDRPMTKILYISGHADSVTVDSVTRRNPAALLPKPFRIPQLLVCVREMLQSPQSPRSPRNWRTGQIEPPAEKCPDISPVFQTGPLPIRPTVVKWG